MLCLRPLKTHKGKGTWTGNGRGQAGFPPPPFSLVCIASVQPPFPSRRRRERPCLFRLHPLAPLYTLHARNDTHRWKGDGERGKAATCQEDDKAADGGERETHAGLLVLRARRTFLHALVSAEQVVPCALPGHASRPGRGQRKARQRRGSVRRGRARSPAAEHPLE